MKKMKDISPRKDTPFSPLTIPGVGDVSELHQRCPPHQVGKIADHNYCPGRGRPRIEIQSHENESS